MHHKVAKNIKLTYSPKANPYIDVCKNILFFFFFFVVLRVVRVFSERVANAIKIEMIGNYINHVKVY